MVCLPQTWTEPKSCSQRETTARGKEASEELEKALDCSPEIGTKEILHLLGATLAGSSMLWNSRIRRRTAQNESS